MLHQLSCKKHLEVGLRAPGRFMGPSMALKPGFSKPAQVSGSKPVLEGQGEPY